MIFTVPTAAEKAGDFSGLKDANGALIPIYNPFTTRPDPKDPTRKIRDPFVGNTIPQSMFDPVGVKLASFYPESNNAGLYPRIANNLNYNMPWKRRQFHMTAKGDHILNNKNRISVRWVYQWNLLPQSSQYPEAAASNQGPMGISRTTDNRARTLGGSWVSTIAPNLINDAIYSYSAVSRDALHASIGGNWPSKLGIQGVPDTAFPLTWVGSYGALGGIVPYRKVRGPLHEFWDTVTYNHGGHTVKAGLEFRYSGGEDQLLNEPSGTFTYENAGTQLQGFPKTGDAFASMLLGYVTNFSLSYQPPTHDVTLYYGAYLQDDWKVTPNLTLNLGLRWDIYPAPMVGDNLFSSFDATRINPVAKVPGVVRFAGVDGQSTSVYPTKYNNLGPRFGFAWRPFGNSSTAIRGAYGIYMFGYGCGFQRLGFTTSVTMPSPDFGQTAVFLARNGVPPYKLPGDELRNDSFGIGQSISFCDGGYNAPYSEQMNFTVQHEVKSILFEAGYVGTMGHHLNSGTTLNQIPADRLRNPGTPQSKRPFPQFSNVSIAGATFGNSTYNSLLLKAEKRYKDGLQFMFSYVFSKYLDDAGLMDQYNRQRDKAISANDRTHNANYSVIWDTPFGKGRRWLTHGILSQVIGGWQASILGVVQSGAPLGFSINTNLCECYAAGTQRPNLLADPALPADQRSLKAWFNTTAFGFPDRFAFGNAARILSLRAPGSISHNAGIMKNFPIRDRFKLQVRGEMFNAFNHTNFGGPSTTVGSPALGAITSSAPAREIQLGMKLYF